MKINQFFSEVLGANVRNPRWSWGAVEPICNRIYLRVWADQIKKIGGKECVLIDRDEYFAGYQSNGIKERRNHVQHIRGGSLGFGIVCEPNDKSDRKIGEYNSETLLKFGKLKKHNKSTWAEIVFAGSSPCSIVAPEDSSPGNRPMADWSYGGLNNSPGLEKTLP